MKRCLCLVFVFTACAAAVHAQYDPYAPHVGYVYPAGARQGTTAEIAVGGQYLGEVDNAYVTGEGVHAEFVEYVRPLDAGDRWEVWQFLRNVVRRRWSVQAVGSSKRGPEDMPPVPDHPWLRDLDGRSAHEISWLRARLFDPNTQPNAQIAEQVNLRITVDAGAAPGLRELRLVTPRGLTNPLRFVVGVLPEVREEVVTAPGEEPTPVDLPAVINGQITPGAVDRFAVRARQGQQLTVRLQARELTPYLADAVPGWFQATVMLRDPQGCEVAYVDDYRFDPDPVLFYKIPAEGVYTLEVRDALYRGRDDFVYRLSVGELPFVTQVFPLGGRAGTETTVTISGWNLPEEKLRLDLTPGEPSLRQVVPERLQAGGSEVLYAVGALPEVLESETAGTEPQSVTLPVIVNGRSDRPGDVDVYSFSGRGGEEVVAEVTARRLNSPLDSVLRLTDAEGKVLATNDDRDDPEMGLMTHHADSYLRLKLPADGTYRITLLDAQQQGGPAYAYRLRLSPPQPDFAVRVTPASIDLGPGGSARLTAHLVRRDGFAGAVDLSLLEPPAGLTMAAAQIPADKDTAELRVSAPRGAPPGVFPLRLQARGELPSGAVTHPATPADDMMQAFAYRHLVPQQQLAILIAGSRRIPAVWRPLLTDLQVATPLPLQIPLGGSVALQVKAPQVLTDRRQTPLAKVRFSLPEPPRGLRLEQTEMTAAGVILHVKVDANAALPGDAGNLIIDVSTAAPADSAGSLVRRPVSLGVLPAVPFVVVR